MTDNLKSAFHNEVASKTVDPSQDFGTCDNAEEITLQRQAVEQQKHHTVCLFLQAWNHDSVCGKERVKRQE